MMLYIGSDNELPLIKWRDEEQAIGVSELGRWSGDGRFANKKLVKKHKYYVGSWQGCGCGFFYDFPEAAQEIIDLGDQTKQEMEADLKRPIEELFYENHKKGKHSVESLFAYIRDNVLGDDCELLSFWAGEYEVKDSIVINLREFSLGDAFRFSEGQYIVVNK